VRWIHFSDNLDAVRSLAAELGLRLPAAYVLWNRGYCDPDSARAFLEAPLEGLHDPMLMKGMPQAVERLHRAVSERTPILLYGDYDVDGTSSVVILKKAIELAGGTAGFHVPHRLLEGYGMRSEVVDEAAARGVKLIISVDTGIRAGEVVRHANALGIDVIVTDHHLPEAEIPPAAAVLNPNQPGCAYPDKNLCGAGVAFKLVHALFLRLGWEQARIRRMLESFLKFVAIATVADVVPLTNENRIIVKRGLAGLHTVRNLGMRALFDVAGVSEGEIPSAGQIAFRIAPRINAAGRMANARDVIDLFTTEDPVRAGELAAQLNELNQERQAEETAILAAILKQCEEQPVGEDQFALVFSAAGWHRGVVGIVASRIVEKFNRPAFVLGEEDGQAQGSGRSIRAFHLLDALESMPDLFTRFGGHKHAAGVGLPVDRVPEFRERLNRYAAARLTPADLEPSMQIDAFVSFSELFDGCVTEVLDLAPFGFGNSSPIFGMRDVEICATPEVWNDKHLKLRLKQNGRVFQSKAWNFADRISELPAGARVDAAISFEPDAYSAARGYAPWCIEVKDVRAAERAASGRAS
jgi:single-stranded-DNA-specific exonuclease